ncbi:diguanylate cyclase [Alteromonas sediminis]|uniref:diguanylate cyclase n=1 Tax=Alteromonas sediminis TaxID=2259342 RepID=A0A3N5Y9Y5_9ALTE|nr:sensor domain-containing diguanylate cyclase [Alteromonas sediminis]RPJ68199.1 diguanylate cyclase [Alteromonas sediminis]
MKKQIKLELIWTFLEVSKDGYAIFDADDKLIYSNDVFADIFCFTFDPNHPISFDQTVRNAYSKKRGINIETDDIEAWLGYVETVRRQREFRLFEVDLVNGRWMLFSEQLLPSGELLVQAKDITTQKLLENQLSNSIQTLNDLALTDELTQLPNRRSFVQSVESELSRCARKNGDITMLILDLDHFKSINDTFGHPAGDEVLKKVSQVLLTTLRQYDIIGRIGGEEFAVFLGTSSQLEASEIAERLRMQIAATEFYYNTELIPLTTSIGMTTQSCKNSFEQLYSSADEALYQAKAQGRNQVRTYTPTP